MQTVDVNPREYDPATGRLRLSWNLSSPAADLGLSRNNLEIRYAPSLENIRPVEVFDIFCGTLLPHLALRSPQLVVRGLPNVGEERPAFWHWYLNELDIVGSVEFIPDSQAPTVSNDGIKPVTAESRSGLYFGGGVESLSFLRIIKHTKPYLLAVDGPSLMNSDLELSSIKGKLQRDLAERYGLEFLRVWTNARTLFAWGDEYVNRYITGSMFYYSLLPLMRRKSINVCYMACELEYSLYELPFDLSLHSRFVHKVSRAPDPPLISQLNASPKIDLLDDLYRADPELCSYLYSCLQNSGARWCGQCGKCRRISAYCEAIGIPPSLIGMPQGISHAEETEANTRALYWKSLRKYKERKDGPHAEVLRGPSVSRWKWLRALGRR